MKAILSLGTNIGALRDNLDQAINHISNHPQIKISRISTYLTTKAWGNENQDDFLNTAVLIETNISPEELLKIVLSVESKMGRIRTLKWEPRIIDIDLILCDDLIINEPHLKIPHPLMHERNFVLSCIIEIAPDFIHPVMNKTIDELYQLLNRG